MKKNEIIKILTEFEVFKCDYTPNKAVEEMRDQLADRLGSVDGGEALMQILEITQHTHEINMGNYNDDDVKNLDNAISDIHGIILEFQQAHPAQPERKSVIEQIVLNVLDGMVGIGGIPGNEDFCNEFDMRLRSAMDVSQSYPTPISEEEIDKVVKEIIGDKLSKEDRVIPEHYVRVTLEWALSKGVKPVSEWISVEDRLPKIYDDDKQLHTLSSDYVMTIKPNGVCTINQLFIRGKDKYCWKSFNKQITHWMPLPEPPNELNK